MSLTEDSSIEILRNYSVAGWKVDRWYVTVPHAMCEKPKQLWGLKILENKTKVCNCNYMTQADMSEAHLILAF